MNEKDRDLEKRIEQNALLKKKLGLHSQVSYSPEGRIDIDLERLALLIDPTTTTKLYSQKKWIGPFLTWMRTSFVKVLYFLFRLDFARVIELHQNVWIMAYQSREMQLRLEGLERELNHMKKKYESEKV